MERRAALHSAFTEEPSKRTLYQLLAHDYFVLGNASEAAKLIDVHRDLLIQLTAPEKRLVDAIEGLGRLLRVDSMLPPVQPNPGYDVERDRWLYCAHSVAPYNSNGYSTRTKGLVTGMRETGMDVLIAARPGYPWDVKTDRAPLADESYIEDIEGVKHVFSNGPSWTQGSLDHYFQQAADAYVQTARRFRVEGIHAASNHVTAFPALTAARRLGLPFTYEVRGLWEVTEASSKPGWSNSQRYQFAHNMEAFVAQEADIVLAITEQVKDELVARGVAEDKIQILPNAVDTEQFSDMPAHQPTRAKLGLDSETPVIGYTGSLVEYEGLDILLQSLKVLKQQGVAAQCVIVGDGPELPRLKDLAESLELESVTFTGRVAPSDIANYISLFDIMPCPRRALPVTEMVPPLKPFEAMAAAKAVVLSDLAPLRALSGPDHARALLCRPDDPGALAETLAYLIGAPEKRREMGRRARLWVVAERTWHSVGRAAVDFDRSVASSRRHQGGPVTRLQDMRIGIIADEFTYSGLAPECSLVQLDPKSWRTQLAANRIDALLVESAWEGNSGAWHRKVGYYDDEAFADLAALTDYCRAQSIPTLFWNKEDPVHFNRFQKTAQHFQHVFTSDDRSISRYLDSSGAHLKTVASVPFYAQPRLHNPLPGTMEYSHTVCYAGSYYGERYKKRSAELEVLLRAAAGQGLTIYDRQHDNADSPYKFPPALRQYVKGGLSYAEMNEAYKAHPVHVNVNSVDDSNTMLSRRVFEIAASGGAIISGPGRGAAMIFDGIVPVIHDLHSAQDVIDFWLNHEPERNRDAWLGLRAVLRSHTAAQRLAYMLRAAGLRVELSSLPSYAVVTDQLTDDVRAQLAAQSHRPSLVVATDVRSEAAQGSVTLGAEIPVVYTEDWEHLVGAHDLGLVARLPKEGVDRTYFEDLLASTRYADWRTARIDRSVPEPADPLAFLTTSGQLDDWDALNVRAATETGAALTLRREVTSVGLGLSKDAVRVPKTERILVAGHDLKFATGLIQHLRDSGHGLTIDQWQGHSLHDEEYSRRALAEADIVLCEWALGNAVWYSNNKLPGQRLVCRVHLQELDTPYLQRMDMDAVDMFIFVGAQIRDRAIRDFGIPANRTVVIPNYVDTEGLELDKADDARWRIGLVGIVPQRKRLDLALDLLSILRSKDLRYTLAIKGKRPEAYPWMAARPDEMEYYERQYERIANDPLLHDAVVFDDHGDDMGSWYGRVGTAISVSDFESFHLTIADGAASGAIPQSLAWAGVDRIYPSDWIHVSIDDMAVDILAKTRNSESWHSARLQAQRFAREQFGRMTVLNNLEQAIIKASASRL